MGPLLRAREVVGHAIGRSWAPITQWTSALRHARTFHPDGVVCEGHVDDVHRGPFEELGLRLRGPVVARFSAALWKGQPRWFDVLGIALRFAIDQDLLFATIRSPFTMPAAPLATNTRDFGGNHYWSVSPFDVVGIGRLKFRITPEGIPAGHDRDLALMAAVNSGTASLVLEARRVFRFNYVPVARIKLVRVTRDADQATLRFDPFRAGAGIVPSGLVHAIRPSAYAGSQRGRRR